MILPAIVSLIFASAISGMVLFRVWSIRRGKILSGEECRIIEDLLSVFEWEKGWESFSVFILGKARKISSAFSRISINFYHIAKKFIEERVEHFSMSIPPVSGEDGEKGSASFFLKDISSHRDSFRNGELK